MSRLWQEEQGFLDHLIIRQRNQHRGSVHFRKLIDVQRKVRQGPLPRAVRRPHPSAAVVHIRWLGSAGTAR
jgi:hypothetical protein